MALIVRNAVGEDVNELVEMTRAHHNEISVNPEVFHCFSFDEIKCREQISHYIGVPSVSFLLVCRSTDEGERVLGYICISLVEPHYSNERYVTELLTYIKPEHRGGKVLHMLIEGAKEVAIKAGAKVLQLGLTSGDAKLKEAYDKRFHQAGSLYHIKLQE